MGLKGTYELFECDTCKIETFAKNSLPKGWVWVKTGGPINHACEKCKVGIPKDKQRESGQLN